MKKKDNIKISIIRPDSIGPVDVDSAASDQLRKPVKNLWRTCYRLVIRCAFLLTLFLAAYVFFGREGVQLLPSYKTWMEEKATEYLGARVEIQELRGFWFGFSPVLAAEQVRLKRIDSDGLLLVKQQEEQETSLLTIEHLEIKLNILQSLLSRTPKITEIHLNGIEVVTAEFLSQQKNDSSSKKRKDIYWQDKLIEFLFQTDVIKVQNAHLIHENPEGQTYPIELEKIALVWQGGYFNLKSFLAYSDHQPSSLSILGKVFGRPKQRSELDGDFVVDIGQQDFKDWISLIPAWYRDKVLIHGKLPVEEAVLSLDAQAVFWLKIKEGMLSSFQTEFSILDYQVRNALELELPESFRLRASWKRKSDHTWFADIHLRYAPPTSDGKKNSQNFKQIRTRLEFDEVILPTVKPGALHEKRHHWRFQLSQLDLLEMIKWIDVLGLDKRLDWLPLDTLQPSGVVDSLAIYLPVSIDNDDLKGRQILPRWNEVKWRLNVSGISYAPFKGIPGASGLNLAMEGEYTQGYANVSLEQGTLDFPKLFRDKHASLQLQVPLQWRYSEEGKGWLIQSGLLNLKTSTAKSNAMFSLKIPKKNTLNTEDSFANKPHLSLVARIYEGQAVSTPAYVPAKILPKNLVKWLDGAIQGGDLIQGDLLYEGHLQKNKNEKYDRVFQMRYQVDNASVKYAPSWPLISQSRVDAWIEGSVVDVRVESGHILGAKVEKAQVKLAKPIEGKRPVIEVIASAKATTPQGVEILKQSPVNNALGGLLGQVKSEGDIQVDLNVDIPLRTKVFKNRKKPKVNVAVLLKNSQLDLVKHKFLFEKVNGNVLYSSSRGLESKKITSRLFNKDVSAKIKPIFSGEKRVSTQLELIGRVNIQELADRYPLSLWHSLSGITGYNAYLTFPANKSKDVEDSSVTPRLEIESEMKGIVWNVPQPLTKAAQESKLVNFRMPLTGQQTSIQVNYANLFDFNMLLSQGSMKKATLNFGAEPARLAKEMGLTISGQLMEADLMAWKGFLGRLVDASKGLRKTRSAVASLKDGTAEALISNKSLMESVSGVNLNIENLFAWDYHLEDVDLQALPIEDGWTLGLRNSSLISIIRVPESYFKPGVQLAEQSVPLDIDVLSLDIEELLEDKNRRLSQMGGSVEISPGKPRSNFQLTKWPPFQVQVRDMRRGSKSLGSWFVHVEPYEKGLFFDSVKVESRGINFLGQMRWNLTGESQNTFLAGRLNTKDIASVMKSWDFTPTLTSETGYADLNLEWPGAPWQFGLSQVTGPMNVKLSNGQLMSVDNAASSVKVIGLLNFNTIQRRLRLDFSDLYKKGLPYDEIDGIFQFNKGVLENELFKISGPSAQFESKGSVNLLNRQVSQELSATLPVSRNLILPAAAAGGLPAAATWYVIDKALGDQLDKLTTLRFQLEGDWNDPKVTEVKLFK